MSRLGEVRGRDQTGCATLQDDVQRTAGVARCIENRGVGVTYVCRGGGKTQDVAASDGIWQLVRVSEVCYDIPGTLTAKLARLDHRGPPTVLLGFKWARAPSASEGCGSSSAPDQHSRQRECRSHPGSPKQPRTLGLPPWPITNKWIFDPNDVRPPVSLPSRGVVSAAAARITCYARSLWNGVQLIPSLP